MVRAILEDPGRSSVGRQPAGRAGYAEPAATGQFSHYRYEPERTGRLRCATSFVMFAVPGRSGPGVDRNAGRPGVSRWNPRSWELGGQPARLAGRQAGDRILRMRPNNKALGRIPRRRPHLYDDDSRLEQPTLMPSPGRAQTPLGRLRGVMVGCAQDHHTATLWIGTRDSGLGAKTLTRTGRLHS